MFHELCHLYDHSKFKVIWMDDEEYHLQHNHLYDINDYDLKTDVSTLTIEDIHNIITESMYYANFTESHAFMENINFEIFEYINKNYYNKYCIFYKASHELYCIYILEQLIGRLKNINEKTQLLYINKYKNDINLSYNSFNSFKSVIQYIYKKLHKIVLHSKVLFKYYSSLSNEEMQTYKLDENMKYIRARSFSHKMKYRRNDNK